MFQTRGISGSGTTCEQKPSNYADLQEDLITFGGTNEKATSIENADGRASNWT